MAITTKEYREGIARRFTQVLEEKQLDWKKGWNVQAGARPENAVSHVSYKGINYFHLMLTAMAEDYKDPRWATFRQIKDKGWKLQKNSQGTKVEYWFPYDTEKQKSITWEEYQKRVKSPYEEDVSLRVKYYTVFNGDRIDGIPELPVYEPIVVDQDDLIKKLSQNMNVEILNDGGDRAFYRPSEDKIHLPEPEQFHSEYDYNATALHELAHSTGAAHRLNRDITNTFGTEGYAYEELVAEISSCFMSDNLQAEQSEYHVKNHQAYVQSWIKHIQEKPEALIAAIKDAEKAADYMEYFADLIQKVKLEKTLKSTFSIQEDSVLEESASGIQDIQQSEEFPNNKNEVENMKDIYENVKQLAEKTEAFLYENYKDPLVSVEKIIGSTSREEWVNMLAEDLTYGASWLRKPLVNLQDNENINPDVRNAAADLCKEIDSLDVVYGQKVSIYEKRRELTQKNLNIAITEAAKRGQHLQLPNCYIDNAKLNGDLTNVNFTNTYFAGDGKFIDVNFEGACFDKATIYAEVKDSNFKNASFKGAGIYQSNFSDANFEHVNFTETRFRHFSFSNSILRDNDYLNAFMHSVQIDRSVVEGEQKNIDTMRLTIGGRYDEEERYKKRILNCLNKKTDIEKEVHSFLDIRRIHEHLDSLEIYNVHNGHSEYISNPSELERLTKEEAEIAVDKGVRIGYAGDHTEYHGIHQDEYEYHVISSKDDLEKLFENHASVSIDPIYRFSGISLNKLAKIIGKDVKVADAQHMDTVAPKELTPELRKKLQELEAGGHHFTLDKGGKVTVPAAAKEQLTPGEIVDVTGYIKDSRTPSKKPAVKEPELEA